jgi:hypothetical protein
VQVQQRFERGWMIWHENTREIFVLFTDNKTPTWLRVTDSFTEGMPERDENIIAPPNLSQPVRGFGYVWRNDQTIRDRLGWAVEGESGYQGLMQAGIQEDGAAVIYMRMQTGTIVELGADGQVWQLIIPEGISPLDVTVPTEIPPSMQDR